MSEPTGHTVDGAPWEDPRPPHLPDRLTAIPLPAWPFIALGALTVGGMVVRLSSNSYPDQIPGIVLQTVPAVSGALLGAALFWRHPDAVRTVPALVIGVSLLAARQLQILVGASLQPVLESVVLAPDGDPPVVPLALVAYGWVGQVLALAGLVAITWGLRGARLRPTRASSRGPTVIVAAAVLGVSLIPMALRGGPSLGVSAAAIIVNSPALVFGMLTVVASSWFTVTMFQARSAGEAPTRGWTLAMIAGVSILAGYVAGGLLEAIVMSSPAAATGGSPVAMVVLAITFVVPWPLLLAAFAVGLPARRSLH